MNLSIHLNVSVLSLYMYIQPFINPAAQLPTYSHTKLVNHLFIHCLKHIFVSIHSSHYNYQFSCVISHLYTHANTNHRSFGQIFAHFSRFFMFVHPSNYPPFHLIIIHLSIRPPAHLSIYLSIHSSNFKLVLSIQLTTQIYIRIRKKETTPLHPSASMSNFGELSFIFKTVRSIPIGRFHCVGLFCKGC